MNQHYVFRLQVAVDHLPRMQVLQRLQQPAAHKGDGLFAEGPSLHFVVELAVRPQFHKHVDIGPVAEHSVELDDVAVLGA